MKKSTFLSIMSLTISGSNLYSMQGPKFDPNELKAIGVAFPNSPDFTTALEEARNNKESNDYKTVRQTFMKVVALSDNPHLAQSEFKGEIGELRNFYRTKVRELCLESKKNGCSFKLFGLAEAVQEKNAADADLSDSLILYNNLTAQLAGLETNKEETAMLKALRNQELNEVTRKESERRLLLAQKLELDEKIAACTRAKYEASQRASEAAKEVAEAYKAKKLLEEKKKNAIENHEKAIREVENWIAFAQLKLKSIQLKHTQCTELIQQLESTETSKKALAEDIVQQKEILKATEDEITALENRKKIAEERKTKLHEQLIRILSEEKDNSTTVPPKSWTGWVLSWFGGKK